MANIYLVAQDNMYMYGDYLNRAVVISESSLKAKKYVMQLVRKLNSEREDQIMCEYDLLYTRKLGHDAKIDTDAATTVVCMSIESDNNLPPGFYNEKKKPKKRK